METLTLKLKVVTPMFLGGAEYNDRAELRPPSIKGAMRFWYRAVDPDYRQHEAGIFGGTGKDEGQAIFALRVAGRQEGTVGWEPNDHNRFNTVHPKFDARPNHSSSDDRTWTLNGVRYLSFPLKMRPNDRKAIPPGETVRLALAFKTTPSSDQKKRILSCLWLLGHVGGLGTRSRRGFGTVALGSWGVEGGQAWQEIEQLPIAHGADSAEAWVKSFSSSLGVIKDWFPRHPAPEHSVFGSNTAFRLFDEGKQTWVEALNEAGMAMQKFRQRWNLNNANSDYHRVKAHLCDKDREAAKTAGAVQPVALAEAPERVQFGLPLTFRYSSLKYKIMRNGQPVLDRNGEPKQRTPEATYQGAGHDRSASPIHIRVVQVGTSYYPLLMRMDAPLLPTGERIKDGYGNYGTPRASLLSDFWRELPQGKDIVWGGLR